MIASEPSIRLRALRQARCGHVREVGKSLGFDAGMQTRLTRLVGSWEWKGPTDTMEHQFRNAGFNLNHPRIAKYLELSLRMLDCRGTWDSIRAA